MSFAELQAVLQHIEECSLCTYGVRCTVGIRLAQAAADQYAEIVAPVPIPAVPESKAKA